MIIYYRKFVYEAKWLQGIKTLDSSFVIYFHICQGKNNVNRKHNVNLKIKDCVLKQNS